MLHFWGVALNQHLVLLGDSADMPIETLLLEILKLLRKHWSSVASNCLVRNNTFLKMLRQIGAGWLDIYTRTKI